MDKRNLFFWSLYDFANSVVQINLLLYLSQWVVVDKGFSEAWYGGVFSFSTFLLLVTSPILGVYADRLRKKVPVIAVMSFITAISLFVLGALTIASPPGKVLFPFLVLGLYLIVNYFYQAALVFFSSLIPTLGKSQFFGRISGWGEFANNAGLIFGVVVTLPIINGTVNFLGGSGRAYVFLPAAIIFFVLALPFFIFFKEKEKKAGSTISIGALGKEALLLIKNLPSFPSMLWFLVGYYFVSDAMRTVLLFFPLYFEKVWGLPDSLKAALTVFSIVFMMIGSVIGGFLADKIGTKKTLLTFVFLTFVFSLPVLLFSKLNAVGWAVIAVLSVFMGGHFAVSRSMLVRLSPKGGVGQYFGLFNLFERFASIVAPLVFSGAVGVFNPLGTTTSYRLSFLAVFTLILLGFVFLKKVKEEDMVYR